ncbi:Coenzyme F420 hydrogenase/dehydrogenase, beta subunit C-terminal domain [uncultured Campylobacter sp.]|uniref:Coenzyme F420 hydrogenase/dehydrogenase, beta subunit C-terminal domain n=1 Tax=uncultured Campylobacter sp. TaxID=218934 RepID=UPI00261F9E1F|nr:Coenzyme F420 hydrogenase/dehydrogenase, beta subunit C-terminal domain [uncultured Campylobacter sp.]
MSFNVISEVVTKDRCIGCGVCASSCPFSVLKMRLGGNGFYAPEEGEGCRDKCDICLKVCPFYEKDTLENELNSKSYSELESFSPDFGRFLATYKFYKKDEVQRLSSASGGAGDYIFRELFARGLIDYAICAVPADEGDFIAQNHKRDFSACNNLAQPQNLQNSATKNSEQNSAIPNLTQNLADDDSINFTSAQNSFCENFTQNSMQNFTNENFAQNSKASCKNSVSTQNFACENSKNARNYAGENSVPLFKFSVIKNADELTRARSSAYYPLTLEAVLKEMSRREGRYAISALPCFAKALRLAASKNPRLKSRISFIIGLVCGQGKGAAFTYKLADLAFKEHKQLAAVNYRYKIAGKSAMSFGFKFRAADGSEAIDDRSSSAFAYWSSRAFTPLACNACTDVFAKCADVVLMDAWLQSEMSEWRGTSLVITRAAQIDALFSQPTKQAREEIFCERISAAEVQRSQQSQVERKNEIFYGAKNPLRRYILRQKLQIQRYSATHFDCDDFIAARLKKIAAANKVLALLALPKIAAYKIYRKFA